MIGGFIQDWKNTLISFNSTIGDVIHNLEASNFQIALVVSQEGVLLGTITDGDIRRGLLRGFSLSYQIESVLNKDPVVVPPNLSRETVLQIMQANKVHQLPIVDKGRKVVGLHAWNSVYAPEVIKNTIFIMAGGEGRRLRPYTENCPKPLLPINGKPMLEYIIERAKREGFSNFVLAINYLGKMIEDYFEDGKKWDVKISYIKESEPLGTAGAISLWESCSSDPFIVCNGDVLTDIRYLDMLNFHNHHSACATMGIRLYEWKHPFGVVKTEGVEIHSFEEKPISRSHVNAGIYVLSPSVFSILEKGKYCDMPTVFKNLRDNRGRTIVYPIHETWLDIGHIADFELAKKKLSSMPF